MIAFFADHLTAIFAACSVVSIVLAVTYKPTEDDAYTGDDTGQI